MTAPNPITPGYARIVREVAREFLTTGYLSEGYIRAVTKPESAKHGLARTEGKGERE